MLYNILIEFWIPMKLVRLIKLYLNVTYRKVRLVNIRLVGRGIIVRYPSHINNSSSFDRMHYFIAAQVLQLQLVTGNV
jgi:hypothetical protein